MAEGSTVICTHCNKVIPAPNFDLHYVHCTHNLESCKICGEMVPKRHAEKHYSNTHIPVTCTLCNETVERVNLPLHKGEICSKRIVSCEYCNFLLPAEDLIEHQEVCENRKTICHRCGRYIRLRDRAGHAYRCHSTFRDIRETEREQGAQRRQRPRDPSQKYLLFTIAFVGIAAVLGSVFGQRKDDDQELL